MRSICRLSGLEMEFRSDEFKGRRVVITGAGSGIGRACAHGFAQCGANLTLIGRESEDLDMVAGELSGDGSTDIIPMDLTEMEAIERARPQLTDASVLVNCAGLAWHGSFLNADAATFRTVFETNVVSWLRLTQVVAIGMAERGFGSILNISSALSKTVYPHTLVYAASKHAIRAVTDGLRMELSGHGIRVTEVRPGLVGRTKFAANTTDPDFLGSLQRRMSKGILPEDVARAVVYAASTRNDTEVDVIEIQPNGQIV